jgi:hypothetical protein
VNDEKKISLFLVEGPSEERALSLLLSRLVSNSLTKFYIVSGDITSRDSSDNQNILSEVHSLVKNFLEENNPLFKKSDIERIVHLIDTDGAFVDCEHVKHKNGYGVVYSDDCILTKDVESIIDRNDRKSLILNKLSSTPEINDIPYSVYYFSTNLDHVLYGKQNLDRHLKTELADKFTDRFDGHEKEFVDFICDSDFAVDGNYPETWHFIKSDLHSLNRYTNLGLYFKN